jgi:hypothetical protein
MARTEDKIKAGAKGLLEPGEEIVAAVSARPRGWTQAKARGGLDGAISGSLGAKKMGGHVEAAREAGFELGSPMALAATNRRLLSIQLSNPVGLGLGMKVKHLIAAVPLTEVDEIKSKRLAVGKVLTATVRAFRSSSKSAPVPTSTASSRRTPGCGTNWSAPTTTKSAKARLQRGKPPPELVR